MKLRVIWTSKFKKDYKLAIKRGANIDLLDDTIRMLANMQSIIQNTMESYNSRYSSLINSFNGYYDMIAENRQELAPTLYGETASEELPQEEQA